MSDKKPIQQEDANAICVDIRPSAEIDRELSETRAKREQVAAHRQALIQASARGEQQANARTEAAELQFDIDVLTARIADLETEHFDAVVAETAHGYAAAYQARYDARAARRDAYVEQDEVFKRTDQMRTDAGNKLHSARAEETRTRGVQEGYIEARAVATKYGPRLIAAVDGAVAKIDAEYRHKLKQQFVTDADDSAA